MELVCDGVSVSTYVGISHGTVQWPIKKYTKIYGVNFDVRTAFGSLE